MTRNVRPSNFDSAQPMPRPVSLLGRMLWLVAVVVVLVLGFMFSLLALVVLLVAGIAFYVFVKWQTRHLRRDLESALRRQPPPGDGQGAPSGLTIEGEVIAPAEYEQDVPRPVPGALSDGSR